MNNTPIYRHMMVASSAISELRTLTRDEQANEFIDDRVDDYSLISISRKGATK